MSIWSFNVYMDYVVREVNFSVLGKRQELGKKRSKEECT